ncbi:MAG: hypothetical protein F4Z95_11145 [Gammaproteobacteria bacterium]|nr:hypothetical protein [Gammaproteobacteria bacterium]
MSFLTPSIPVGRPAFALSDDQVATVLDLICRGAHDARSHVTSGMHEVPITRIVRKCMKRVKVALGLTNLQVIGEHELDDMATNDPIILGRIDIILQFAHQFGIEDAYVAVECKRVRPGDATLNGQYVSAGVRRFVTGKYAAGHEWGFMLGYVLALPTDIVIQYIDRRLRNIYGASAALKPGTIHSQSLAIRTGTVPQSGQHRISLQHVFVDMLTAGP